MILKKLGEPQGYEDLVIKLQEEFDGVVNWEEKMISFEN